MFLDTQNLTARDFQHEIGQVFTAETVPEPVELTLLNVTQGPASRNEFRPPFTLHFTSQINVLLLEAQYSLKSASGRQYMIYLSPLAPQGSTLRHYQAHFN